MLSTLARRTRVPRAKTNKLYRTFVKGLITEAGYLTYPENASSDELNTIISRKGNRTRRLGIKYEDNYVLSPVSPEADNPSYQEYTWRSVNKQPGMSMIVVQVGGNLHFWELNDSPLSDDKKPFTLNLRDFKAPTATDLDVITNPAQFASGAGYLFVAHKHCEPLSIEYDKKTNTISAIRVVVQVRDFEGVYDGLANDQEPTTLSAEHHYNLMNQGWVAPGTTPSPALAAGEAPNVGGDGAYLPGAPEPTGGNVYINPYTGTEDTYTPGGGGRTGPRISDQEREAV